jgi:hypothetical protein
VPREPETKAHYSLTPPTNGTGDVTSTPGTNSNKLLLTTEINRSNV